MADVFISYKQKSNRSIADILAGRLSQYNISVWYDKRLESSELWRRRIYEELSRARVVVTLWSPEAVKSDFIQAESQIAYNLDRDLPVKIADCDLEPPFNRRPWVDLRGWPDGGSEEGYWDLVERIAERLGHRDVLNLVLEARYESLSSLESGALAHTARKRVNSYDYTEMILGCEELRDNVREFDPDVFLCLDARSGFWAEMLFDWLQRRIPVVVGFRLEDTGDVSLDELSEFYHFRLNNRLIFIPKMISQLPRQSRILLVLDHSAGYDEELIFHNFVREYLAYPGGNVATLTLIASELAKSKAKDAAQNSFFREQSEEAAYISIFYRDDLIPFSVAAKG